jgi:hypothetical protein
MVGTLSDSNNSETPSAIDSSNNNSDALVESTTNNANTVEGKKGKWQNKKRKFNDKSIANARLNSAPRSIIGSPLPKQSAIEKQDSLVANSNNNSNSNSASVVGGYTGPSISDLNRPSVPLVRPQAQSLPLPLFAPPSLAQQQTPYSYQQQQQYAYSQQLLPPPSYSSLSWPQNQQQQQQYQVPGNYHMQSLQQHHQQHQQQQQQQQHLPSPNFSATPPRSQQQHRGQTAEDLRRRIKMMNSTT